LQNIQTTFKTPGILWDTTKEILYNLQILYNLAWKGIK